MIKAILYDLDGVLVDATEWHYESLNLALEEIVGFKISREEHLTTFNGLPTKQKLEILQKQGRLTPTSFQKIWVRKQELTFDVIEKFATVDIIKMKLHQGIKMYKKACVTNSIRKSAILMLKKTGQMKFMDFIISNEDVVSPKPSPEGYVLAMKKLGLTPKECLIVEDSPKGIDAARMSEGNVFEVRGYHDVTLENVLRKINYYNNM